MLSSELFSEGKALPVVLETNIAWWPFVEDGNETDTVVLTGTREGEGQMPPIE